MTQEKSGSVSGVDRVGVIHGQRPCCALRRANARALAHDIRHGDRPIGNAAACWAEPTSAPGPLDLVPDTTRCRRQVLRPKHDSHALRRGKLLEAKQCTVSRKPSDRRGAVLPAVIEVVIPEARHVAGHRHDRGAERREPLGKRHARREARVIERFVERHARTRAHRPRGSTGEMAEAPNGNAMAAKPICRNSLRLVVASSTQAERAVMIRRGLRAEYSRSAVKLLP